MIQGSIGQENMNCTGNSLLGSKAFDEFLRARCTEILQEDDELKKIGEQILNAESALIEILSDEQKKLYNEVEVYKENLLDYFQTLIYKTCVLYIIGVK